MTARMFCKCRFTTTHTSDKMLWLNPARGKVRLKQVPWAGCLCFQHAVLTRMMCLHQPVQVPAKGKGKAKDQVDIIGAVINRESTKKGIWKVRRQFLMMTVWNTCWCMYLEYLENGCGPMWFMNTPIFSKCNDDFTPRVMANLVSVTDSGTNWCGSMVGKVLIHQVLLENIANHLTFHVLHCKIIWQVWRASCGRQKHERCGSQPSKFLWYKRAITGRDVLLRMYVSGAWQNEQKCIQVVAPCAHGYLSLHSKQHEQQHVIQKQGHNSGEFWWSSQGIWHGLGWTT